MKKNYHDSIKAKSARVPDTKTSDKPHADTLIHFRPETTTDQQLRASELHTAELQWLEHLGNHENMFETRLVQANEC